MPQTRVFTHIGPLFLVVAAIVVTTTIGLAQTAASSPEATTLSPEVRQAVRLLLSGNAQEASRGEAILKSLGPSTASQLRLWARQANDRAARVHILLAEMEGGAGRSPGMASLSASEFLQRKILECRSLIVSGEYGRALGIADAILVLDRDHPSAWLLHRLTRQIRERRVARDVLEPIVEIEKSVYEVGEDPVITFRLVNHQRKRVNIQVTRGIIGEMDVSVVKMFLDGSMRRDETKLNIRVPGEVETMVIGPGESWTQRVQFGVPEPLPLSGVVVRARIGGRFRPSHWSFEGIDKSVGLTVGGAELWIVPPGESAMCERPLEKLTAALVFGRLEPFFVGGQLSVWAGQEDAYLNEKLIVTLVNSMGKLEALRLDLAGRFLDEATGLSFGADAEKWKAWLTKSKE